MDELTRDTVLRQHARQTTRRTVMGALLGSGLALGGVAASEANKKAKRRKKRQRKGPHIQSALPMSLIIDNSPGLGPVTVRWGYTRFSSCIEAPPLTLEPGQIQTLNSPLSSLWVWLGDRYWFQLNNPIAGRPDVGVAVHGKLAERSECSVQNGTIIEWEVGLDPNQTLEFNIENQARFAVTRRADLRTRKLFSIRMPPTLPGAMEDAS